MSKSILLFRGTGLTGSECLKLLLKDDDFGSVTAPVRTATGISHSKLREVKFEFDNIKSSDDLFKADAVICSLGTTIHKAKTKEKFRQVDFDIPLAIAKAASEAVIPHFALVSSLGADSSSSVFYYKVKGELEEAVQHLSFKRITIVRPSVILGERKERRIKEDIIKIIAPLIPKKYKPVPASRIAEVIIKELKSPGHGVKVISNSEMTLKN